MKFIYNNNCKPVNGTSWKKSLVNISDERVPWCFIFVACKYWLSCPCSISLLPKHRTYKTLPAQSASSLSVELTQHSLLNEPTFSASCLQNRSWSISLLLKHRAYKHALLNEPGPYASSLQNNPCRMSQFPELPAYKTRPAQCVSSLSFELTKHSLIHELASQASSLQIPPCSMSLLPEHPAYKTLPDQRAKSLSIKIRNPPCSMSQLPEHWAYKDLPG